MRHHSVSFQILADDTQMYLPFETSKPPELAININKLNICIAYLHIWILNNKLKIDFLIISSAACSKHKLDNIFLNVGTSKIQPSQKCNNKHFNFRTEVSQVRISFFEKNCRQSQPDY